MAEAKMEPDTMLNTLPMAGLPVSRGGNESFEMRLQKRRGGPPPIAFEDLGPAMTGMLTLTEIKEKRDQIAKQCNVPPSYFTKRAIATRAQQLKGAQQHIETLRMRLIDAEELLAQKQKECKIDYYVEGLNKEEEAMERAIKSGVVAIREEDMPDERTTVSMRELIYAHRAREFEQRSRHPLNEDDFNRLRSHKKRRFEDPNEDDEDYEHFDFSEDETDSKLNYKPQRMKALADDDF